MRASEMIGCSGFPCADVRHECYLVPGVEVRADDVWMVMISEAAPQDVAGHAAKAERAGGPLLFAASSIRRSAWRGPCRPSQECGSRSGS